MPCSSRDLPASASPALKLYNVPSFLAFYVDTSNWNSDPRAFLRYISGPFHVLYDTFTPTMTLGLSLHFSKEYCIEGAIGWNTNADSYL